MSKSDNFNIDLNEMEPQPSSMGTIQSDAICGTVNISAEKNFVVDDLDSFLFQDNGNVAKLSSECANSDTHNEPTRRSSVVEQNPVNHDNLLKEKMTDMNNVDIINLLWDCIENGNCASLEKLLRTDVKNTVIKLCEMNITESLNLYTYAGKIGCLNIIRCLANADIDLFVPDEVSNTILHTSIQNEHFALVELLLNIKALTEDKINMKDLAGRTALHYAVNVQNKDIVCALLDAGAHVDIHDNFGSTPLHLAAQCHDVDVLKDLINKSTDLNCIDKDGNTVLHISVACGLSAQVTLLLTSGVEADKPNHAGIKPLHIACKEGNSCIAEHLILHGCDPFLSSMCNGKSVEMPIVTALNKNRINVVKLIMNRCRSPQSIFKLVNVCSIDDMIYIHSYGVTFHQRDSMGQTALHYCAARGSRNSVINLLKLGLEAKSKDCLGNDPMHIAIASKNWQSMLVLSANQSNQDWDQCNNNGESYLYLSIKSRFNEAFKVLVHKGADIKRPGPDGQSLLYHAVLANSPYLVRELLGNNLNPRINIDNTIGRKLTHLAATQGNSEILASLLKRGCHVNMYETSSGYTPLHYAAINGHLSCVVELLRASADVNVYSHNMRLPIHLAARHGHTRIVEILKDAGSSISFLNRNGTVDYDLAKHKSVWDALTGNAPPYTSFTTAISSVGRSNSLGNCQIQQHEATGWERIQRTPENQLSEATVDDEHPTYAISNLPHSLPRTYTILHNHPLTSSCNGRWASDSNLHTTRDRPPDTRGLTPERICTAHSALSPQPGSSNHLAVGEMFMASNNRQPSSNPTSPIQPRRRNKLGPFRWNFKK